MLTHLMSLDVFTPIVNLAIREAKRDSLLSCTCQEFFEYLRKVGNSINFNGTIILNCGARTTISQ